MLKILIVDDNDEKVRYINEVIMDNNEISAEVVNNLTDAYKLLKNNIYDVVILDIQIPKRQGEPPCPNGGIELINNLNDMAEIIEIKMPSSIIGMTAYDETFKHCEEYFKNALWLLIKYDITSNDWEKKIRKKIEHIQAHKKTLQENQKDYDYDVGIICALHKVELENVKKVFGKYKEISLYNDSTKYFEWEITSLNKKLKVVATSSFQMGMPAAAVTASKIIQHFKPKYLAMTGISAGISSSGVKIGDILLADPSWDYGAGKFKENNGKEEFLQNSSPIRVDPKILTWCQDISSKQKILNEISEKYQGNKPNNNLHLHIGPVASGASVIATSNILDNIIKQNRKTIGIEMEVYGVYCAGYYGCQPKPIVFALKSVSDYADDSKSDGYQDYAAFTSASVLKHIIKNYIALE